MDEMYQQYDLFSDLPLFLYERDITEALRQKEKIFDDISAEK